MAKEYRSASSADQLDISKWSRMVITTETIFWTVATIIGFVVALFVPYRVLCEQKDATIQLLNEKIAGLKDKVEDAKSQAPDVLAQQLGIRVNRLEEELRRLQQDYSSTQGQVTAKETELTRVRDQLEGITYLSKHDALTGVYNRRTFWASAEHLLNSAQMDDGKLAFLVFDIDAFKVINDRYGHSFGDLLLIAFAERLKKTLGSDALIARYGGDEFVSVIKVRDLDRVKDKVLELIQAIKTPFLVEDKEIRVSMSTGVSLFPQHGRTPGDLLRSAGEATRQAKRQHKGEYAIFS